MRIGTADAAPGELARGYLEVATLPTEITERLPVLIAEGGASGPTLWVVASIHGNEVTPMAVAQDVLTEDVVARMRGRVVCIPTLNPAGIRRNVRTSYYHDDDPNRYFPDPDGEDSPRPPRLQEAINRRVYDRFAGSADALISLHSAQVGAIPYVVRPRVPYGRHRTEAEARALADRLDALVTAFGLPTLQYDGVEYRERDLRRSTAGAALERAGIPAFTPELGTTGGVVIEDNRRAGVIGVRNVMRAMDILAGDPVPNDVTPDAPVDFPVKRPVDPRTDTPGLLRLRIQPGDPVTAGDPVADVVTPTGEHKTTVHAEHDGYVLSHRHGVAAYPNDPVAHMAARDDGELVRPAGDPSDQSTVGSPGASGSTR